MASGPIGHIAAPETGALLMGSAKAQAKSNVSWERRCQLKWGSYTVPRMIVNRRILACAFPWLLVSLCACDKVHKKLADLDYKQGVKKYYDGNMAGASNYFSGAIDQNTNLVYAYVYRGNILLGCSNFTLALQDFDRALALKPQDGVILTDRAAVLCRLDKFSEAASNCTVAIQQNPNFDYAYKYRALSRVYLRDWNGAMEDLNESEKLSANDPWTYSTRAGLRNLRREYEGAVDDATF
jgi:tetratricopeptide (TPR) repeat protein